MEYLGAFLRGHRAPGPARRSGGGDGSVGVVGAALLSAIWLIRERARTFDENALLRSKVADLGAALQRAEAMLNLRVARANNLWNSYWSKN